MLIKLCISLLFFLLTLSRDRFVQNTKHKLFYFEILQISIDTIFCVQLVQQGTDQNMYAVLLMTVPKQKYNMWRIKLILQCTRLKVGIFTSGLGQRVYLTSSNICKGKCKTILKPCLFYHITVKL